MTLLLPRMPVFDVTTSPQHARFYKTSVDTIDFKNAVCGVIDIIRASLLAHVDGILF